ncbi:MAG: MATE family efflux transporter [Epulopiscium sp. Nele67-Bin004]|nr:MAG: MATE family efflux transporter [Epulopiscium sp. Nele67-Bin004]
MFKQISQPVDLTTGRPLHKIILFMIPMLIGNIAQQLYNTVDSIIVGQFSGDNALAAVGSAGPILNLLLVFFVGISIGASIMVSQYFGAKDRENLSAAIECCILLTGVSTIFLMITTPFIVRPLLVMIDTPETIIDECYRYLVILFVGIGGLAYYNILAGVLRGLGDSISPLRYLLVATVINIILDLVFVAYFDMGAAGVALATAIAQYVSAFFCIRKLFSMKDVLSLNLKKPQMQFDHIKTIFRLGLPSGFTQMVLSFALIVVQSLTNSYGEMFIAANVIIMRVDGFAMMPNFSFGSAMSTYAGQNIGANKPERVVQGAKEGTIFAVCVATTITTLILLFGRNLMSVFTNTEELVDLSMSMMKIIAPGYIAMAITQCLSGIIRGAGDTITPMWISIFISVIIRVPVSYGIAYFTRTPELPNGQPASVFISLLACWILGAVLTTIFYRKGAWKEKALQPKTT